MQEKNKHSLFKKLKTIILGESHNLSDPSLFHKISLIAIFAWIGLGSDPLSSSAYGPQEAFLALLDHPYLVLFVALLISLTVLIISISYSQIIDLFPHGGGGYIVASKLLSPTLGMISGCALLIDYVLTISVSIASSSDALFSFLPHEWLPFKLLFSMALIVLLILLNMRGTKESVISLVPIFLLFVITHVFAIGYAIIQHINGVPTLISSTAADFSAATVQLGLLGTLFIILHAYSMGAGTFTGIEAVSNGVPIMREPKVATAKKTMKYIAFSLIFMVMGLMVAFLLVGVKPEAGKTLNAVFFESISQNWGSGIGYYFVLLSLLADAALLFVAAQTGFIDGPRVLSNMAVDKWFPTKFASLSDRLVTQKGVLFMGGAALLTLLISRGSVTFLVILYSIAVFITFSLSQAGMVRHWWNSRSEVKGWLKKLIINGVGLVLSLFILISVVTLKLYEGAWITLLILAVIVCMVFLIKSHYNRVEHLIRKLDYLVPIAKSKSSNCFLSICENDDENAEYFDPYAKTALVFVKGFDGLGLKTLSNIFSLFGNSFKNFIFIEVGVLEAGVFKGSNGIKLMEEKAKRDVNSYVKIVNKYGYYGEGIYSIGTELIDEVVKITPSVLARFPNSVFFAGQMVFAKDSVFSKVLHNHTVFSLQEKLYRKGIPFITIPVNV